MSSGRLRSISLISGLDDMWSYSPADREALHNAVLTLYDYIFSALLSAEMTSRQNTLFNFTIQLLLNIPSATLDTLIDLMQPNGLKQFEQYLPKLDHDARRFFELKFNSPEFDRTKEQVRSPLRREAHPHAFADVLGAKVQVGFLQGDGQRQGHSHQRPSEPAARRRRRDRRPLLHFDDPACRAQAPASAESTSASRVSSISTSATTSSNAIRKYLHSRPGAQAECRANPTASSLKRVMPMRKTHKKVAQRRMASLVSKG